MRKQCNGFTLIEMLVALTISLLLISMLFELFIANQRSLKAQIALSLLASRMDKITAIFRHDIHRAKNVRVISGGILQVDSNTYQIINNKLIFIDASHRKITLVEEVSDMRVMKIGNGVDVAMWVAAGAMRSKMHVFTALM